MRASRHRPLRRREHDVPAGHHPSTAGRALVPCRTSPVGTARRGCPMSGQHDTPAESNREGGRRATTTLHAVGSERTRGGRESPGVLGPPAPRAALRPLDCGQGTGEHADISALSEKLSRRAHEAGGYPQEQRVTNDVRATSTTLRALGAESLWITGTPTLGRHRADSHPRAPRASSQLYARRRQAPRSPEGAVFRPPVSGAIRGPARATSPPSRDSGVPRPGDQDERATANARSVPTRTRPCLVSTAHTVTRGTPEATARPGRRMPACSRRRRTAEPRSSVGGIHRDHRSETRSATRWARHDGSRHGGHGSPGRSARHGRRRRGPAHLSIWQIITSSGTWRAAAGAEGEQ